MAEKLASELIVDCLIEAGIDHVFGLPGGAMMDVYKVLHGREGEIRTVVPRDEQTSSCMADMYGKLTGKPGMFGVIEACLASSPMLVLSELSEAHEFVMHGPIQSAAGQYGSFDLPAMFKGATKFTTVAHCPSEAVLGVRLGIKHAIAGRPGPAVCLFRGNSLREPVAENGLPEIHDTTRLLNPNNSVPPEAALDAASDVLVGATSPVIVAGMACASRAPLESLKPLPG